MADIEERPSKIRKLDVSDEVSEGVPTSELTQKDNVSDIPEDFEQGNDSEKSTMDQTPETANLSKSQLKKLRKRQEWEAGKDFRRLKRREKHKEKQTRKADAREELRAKIESGEVSLPDSQAEKKKGPSRPIQVPVTLILDCDFDELMLDKEIVSLSAQLTRCYSDNKSTPFRAYLAISSWGGTLKTRFETVLTGNHLSWRGVRFMEKNFVGAAEEMDGIMRGPTGGKLAGALAPPKEEDVAPVSKDDVATDPRPTSSGEPFSADLPQALQTPGSIPTQPSTDPGSQLPASEAPSTNDEAPAPLPQIVYLTSDSPHTLEILSPNTSYIIGGIVDKNRHKGLCYKRACELGIPTAKLPIGEYMTMQSRSVLAVNHVVEIMLKWLEKGDWGEAFLSVIPKRKEARLKQKDCKREESESENENESNGEDGGVKLDEEEHGIE